MLNDEGMAACGFLEILTILKLLGSPASLPSLGAPWVELILVSVTKRITFTYSDLSRTSEIKEQKQDYRFRNEYSNVMQSCRAD